MPTNIRREALAAGDAYYGPTWCRRGNHTSIRLTRTGQCLRCLHGEVIYSGMMSAFASVKPRGRQVAKGAKCPVCGWTVAQNNQCVMCEPLNGRAAGLHT